MMRPGARPIDRVVQRVLAGFVAYYLLNAIVVFAPRADEGRPLTTVLIVFCYVGAGVIGLRGWHGKLGRTDILTSLALLASTIVLNHLWGTEGIGIAGGPAFGGVSVALLVQLVTLGPIGVGLAGVGTVLAYAGGLALGAGAEGWWNGLDDGFSHLGFEVAFVITLVLLRRAADEAQVALAADVRAEAERSSAEAVHRAQRESQRILHDDVIASLMAIELNQGSADAVRTAAQHARRAFDPRTLRPAPSTASALPPLSLTVHTRLNPEPKPDFVPREVDAALALACMEALRNVERHAHTHEAWVDGRIVDGESVTVTVRDEGRGFATDSAPGFGVQQGIVARMAEVGGHARIDSRPGAGTTVTLSWHAPTTDAVTRELHAGDVVPFLPLMAGSALAIEAWLPLRHLWSEPHPFLLACTGIGSALLTLGLAAMVRNQVSRAPVGVVMAAQILLLATNLSIVGASSLSTFRAWIVPFVCVPLIVIGFAYSTRLAIACGAVVSAAIGVIAWTSSDVTVAAGSASISQPLLITAGAVAVASGIRRSQRVARERRRSALDAGRVTSDALTTNRELRERLTALRASIVPFLDELVAGTRDPCDPATRDTARALAIEARDELYLHELLDDELRRLLRDVRRAGCDLTVRSSEATTAPPAVAAILRHALDPGRTKRAVMILPQEPGGETRLRMTPPLSADRARDLTRALADIQVSVTSDEESTTVSVRA